MNDTRLKLYGFMITLVFVFALFWTLMDMSHRILRTEIGLQELCWQVEEVSGNDMTRECLRYARGSDYKEP